MTDRRVVAILTLTPTLTLLIGAMLTGCTPVQRSVPEATLVASDEYAIVRGLNVPDVTGIEGCGAQALATAIGHVDPAIETASLAEALPWHDVGATPVDLLLGARARGYTATIAAGTWDDLVVAIEADHAILVMIDSAPYIPTLSGPIPTSDVMHWAVFSGAKRDGTTALLAAPGRRHYPVERDDFESRWARSDRCMITITPLAPITPTPPTLPSCSDASLSGARPGRLN